MIVRSKANSILNDIFQQSHYIGLSTTTPTATGGNITEPASSTGYKRMQLNAMGSANDGQIQNSDIIFFPESLASWGKITHFVIYTGKNGSAIFFGEVNKANGGITIPGPDSSGNGYVPIFRAGALKVGLDKDKLD